QASISLLGAFSQSLYLKPLLERVGLQAEVLARGEYKTAGEPVLRETMSEPQREQVAALLDVVQRELEQAVAARPGWGAERAREPAGAGRAAARRLAGWLGAGKRPDPSRDRATSGKEAGRGLSRRRRGQRWILRGGAVQSHLRATGDDHRLDRCGVGASARQR